MHYKILNNGVRQPLLGFGVFRMEDAETEQAVLEALNVGFRYIDTAQMYGNEEAVGRALKRSKIEREELFIVSKLGVLNNDYQHAKRGVEDSLEKLGLDYIDLYLIHQPFNDYYGAWRALSELYEEGKIRAIGVDNFTEARMADFIEFNYVKPAVDYLEIHPYNQPSKELEYLRYENISPVAWSPFAAGQFNLLRDPNIVKIATKYEKTPAQVILRWLVQNEIPTVVKSTKKDRMRENIEIFNFELHEEDMKIMNHLNKNKSLGGIRTTAKEVNEFLSIVKNSEG